MTSRLRTVVFDVAVLERLLPHAERRRVSVNALCRDLLQAIVEDRLVDAVLDDEAR